ncbi:MAG: hypothetical protein GY711_32910 [bacterium]|nr:hypothetical protein [bacterium]
MGGSDLLTTADVTWLGVLLDEGGPLVLTNVFDKAPGSTSQDFHTAVDGIGLTPPASIVNFESGAYQEQWRQWQRYNTASYGPTFGGGHDIWVQQDSSSGFTQTAWDEIEVFTIEVVPLGTNYCTAVANSTGETGKIQAGGSPVALDNDFFLTAVDRPPNEFGYFLANDISGFIANPSGSNGNFCLGGGDDLGRFWALQGNTGDFGYLSIEVDTQAIPVAAAFPPAYAPTAGDT